MSKAKKNILLILIAVISIAFIFIVLYLYVRQFSVQLSIEQSDWAGFGSYVGGTLGTFFAFASFGILFYTFNSQQKQAKNNEIQKFENTFYSLLELHNQSLKELESKLDKYTLKHLFEDGMSAKSIISRQFEEFSMMKDDEPEEEKIKRIKKRLKYIQNDILQEVEISQYFRILYQLLKFVAKHNVRNPEHKFDDEYLDDRSNISLEYEKMYASLIRGFVPVKFLPILALNCIPTKGGLHNLTKYRRLLERYDFLEHIQLKPLYNGVPTFLIFEKYSHALGENIDIKAKIEEVHSKFPHLCEIDSMKNGYLLKYLKKDDS